MNALNNKFNKDHFLFLQIFLFPLLLQSQIVSGYSSKKEYPGVAAG